MGADDVMKVAMRLNASVEGLAALVASLRVREEALEPGAPTAELLDRVVEQLGLEPATLDRLTPEERQSTIAAARTFFRQAEDLMGDPGRPPGWGYDDPVVLQSQGRTSGLVATLLAGVAPGIGDLEACLRRAGARFLDVGTGVALMAVALCRAFPELHVVGIDVWRPALELADVNVRDAGLTGRIELREQSVAELDEAGAFDAAWISGPFLPRGVFEEALDRVATSLVGGGWMVVGLYAAPDDPLAGALDELRVVRSGGHPWRVDEVEARLRAAGLCGVQPVERTWSAPIRFVVGRKGVG